ncbi:winged helix-turn-helix transcriptional regulator [Candidatus Woesearchaeota archaeon]|nr:winged helix-turn-helix transcriptional regulator [Candidatus Woesearchaeota archaeon]
MICNSYERFFKTLAEPAKLEIINLLSKGPLNVSQLSKKLNFEQSRASHNLKALADRHFVLVERKGKERYYSLDKTIIAPILRLIDAHVEKYEKHYCKCKGIPWRKKE